MELWRNYEHFDNAWTHKCEVENGVGRLGMDHPQQARYLLFFLPWLPCPTPLTPSSEWLLESILKYPFTEVNYAFTNANAMSHIIALVTI